MRYARQNRGMMALTALRAPRTPLEVGDGMSTGISSALTRALRSFSSCPPPAEGSSMAFLSVTSCALVCFHLGLLRIQSSETDNSKIQYSINRRLTLSSPKWPASSCDFAFERKSDCE